MSTPEQKKRFYTTPRGEALFARLLNPDYGTERYPDPRGSFHLTLALDAPAAAELDALLEPALENARASGRQKCLAARNEPEREAFRFVAPGILECDRAGRPTGRRLFRFRTNAFYPQTEGARVRRALPVFNAALERMELFEEPGNGSLVRVAFSVAPYCIENMGLAGLSLFLDSVQILKLNARARRSGEAYGFCVEEPDCPVAADAAAPSFIPNDVPF